MSTETIDAGDLSRKSVEAHELKQRLLAPDVRSGVAAGLQLAELRIAKARTGQKVATALLDALQDAAETPQTDAVAVEIIESAFENFLIETGKEG